MGCVFCGGQEKHGTDHELICCSWCVQTIVMQPAEDLEKTLVTLSAADLKRAAEALQPA